MTLSLLSTKLHAPAATANLVARARLLEQLDGGLRVKLILVSAPAGAGKSTLLGSWVRQQKRPTAWLSLDKGDNDLARFLLYLVTALQQLEPGIGVGLPEVLQTQTPLQAEPLIIRLINDISRLDRDLLLVLDDYHLLSNEQIHDAVEFLLDHLPPQLCLVIATRSDPPLALARLRVQRQMLEIRADDLRFSLQEATVFLNDELGLELSPTAIASLAARTEGWVAGLQLAALSLRGREDKEAFVAAFAGSHRYLVDYLVDEVLERQSEEVRRFLQRTSILDRFTASLCGVVTEQPESALSLRQLATANLFLIPLDDEGQWYRYHHLFAEFLRHRLHEAEADRIPELHLLASTWLEQEGWTAEAIEHALMAKDFERAGRLVEGVAFELSAYWNNAQLVKYVERFPLGLLPAHPRLCIYYGWALSNTGRVGALAALLPVIERSSALAQQPHIITTCILTLRAYQRMWQLDFAGAVDLCEKALALLGSSQRSLNDEERWLRVAATNFIAYSYLYSNPARADAFYPMACALSQRLGQFGGAINGFARHGRVKHQLGQLHAALEVFHQGLSTVESWDAREGRERSVVNVGSLHLNLARLHYEWNRLDEAETHLQRAKALNKLSQFPPVLARELETAFHLHLARGETEAAHTQLSNLDGMVNEVHPDNLFYQQMFGVMAMEMRLQLAQVDPSLHHLIGHVAQWVKARGLDAGDSFDYPHEGSYHVLARLLMAQGNWAEAWPLLRRLAQAAKANGRMDDTLRYLLLQALSHQALAREAAALETVQSALHLAEPEGHCRSFVDLGQAMQTLLQKVAKRRNTPYLTKLLAAFPESSSLSTSDARSASSPSPSHEVEPPAEPDRPPPLNEREQTVLRLLAAGNSNKEIAKEMRLSPNTIRWYVSSLLSKLGAASRLEAVSRARELGLL